MLIIMIQEIAPSKHFSSLMTEDTLESLLIIIQNLYKFFH